MVVAILVVAGVSTLHVLELERADRQFAPLSIPDGPTYFGALAKINASIQMISGGPWALFSAYGIAAQGPFSPNVVSYPNQNRTVNSCSHDFPGLTVWNGSIPVFNGTFNTGTAPFWQFAFYSNSTKQIDVAVVTTKQSRVYPPIPVGGQCSPWYDFYGNPAKWITEVEAVTTGSAPAARDAFSTLQSAGWSYAPPIVEFLQIGPGMFDLLGDPGSSGFEISFQHCGIAGRAGLSGLAVAQMNASGKTDSSFVGSTNCAALSSGYPSIAVYHLLFNTTTTVRAGPTEWLITDFQVALSPVNGTVDFWDGWGLANWMVRIAVENSSTSIPALAVPTCTQWVPSLAACPSSANGWFAVLLSSYGTWVDSYGITPSGVPGWSEPVDALVSAQQLVVVEPSSWSGTAETLSAASTVSTSTVLGSATL